MRWFSNIILSNSEKPLLLIYPDKELEWARSRKDFILGKVTSIFDKELIEKATNLSNIYTIQQLDTDRLYNEIHSLSYEIEYDKLDHLNSIYKHMNVEEYSTEDKIVLLIIIDKTIKHLTNELVL